MAKWGGLQNTTPIFVKCLTLWSKHFIIFLETKGLLALSDGYTGNKITIVIKLHRLFPIAVGGSHFFV